MDFALLILVTTTLFVRPAEIIPDLAQWPIYEILILGCLAMTFPKVIDQLRPARLVEQPVTACVLGMLVAVAMSHIARLHVREGLYAGLDFSKVVVYYLLLVSVVDTPQRLRAFLLWLLACIGVVAGLAVLQYHGIIDIPALAVLTEGGFDARTGEFLGVLRLQSTGIFNDPNDLSLILVVGMVVAAYWVTDNSASVARIAAVGGLGLFGYAFALTKSRGGLLALMGALLALFHARYGWRKTIVLSALALPLLLYVFEGRQTAISTTTGTSQQRIQLWSQALMAFRASPIFGIGNGNFSEDHGLVPHNSYVQSYVELGLFGGTAFFAAFFSACLILYRLRGGPEPSPPDDLTTDQFTGDYGPRDEPVRALSTVDGIARMRPYLLAMIVGYGVGMVSLSRNLVVPTYLIVGLAAVFAPLVQGGTAPVRVNGRFVAIIALCSAGFLAAMYVATRLTVRWGGQ